MTRPMWLSLNSSRLSLDVDNDEDVDFVDKHTVCHIHTYIQGHSERMTKVNHVAKVLIFTKL